MVFKSGDRVRVKDDNSGKTWIVSSVFRELNEVLIQGFEKNETCHRLVNPAEIVLVDQNEDIKQAIREVLLSEEFLKAFAAAWVKTPILHESELNLIVADETRPYKSWNEIIKESFQPMPTAEVSLDATLEPITGSESEAYYLNKLKNGESN